MEFKISESIRLFLAVLTVCLTFPLLLHGQATPLVEELPRHDIPFALDSSPLFHVGEGEELIWSETIQVDGAYWLRLRFSHLMLAGSPLGGPSSTLRITSLEDGAYQILNSRTAREWRNTSAYFNGNAVRLELFACPNGRLNLVRVDQLTVGEASGPDGTGSICDDSDDRQLSEDPRVGRSIPGGCTLWLFDDRNNCLLTAGHCASSTDVASFNVPLSDANGNYRFPGPEDQYSVDPNSMQVANNGVGNDWCYFGCFPNSNTGLTAFQAQGSSFQLADPQPIQGGDMIRITGHGSTSFPVDPSWNGAQKTQLGPYFQFTTMELRYRTDTTGGNSGSPVILETTGEAIGIHTHGGCGSAGNGSNAGTGFLNTLLAAALDNPQGVCDRKVGFEFLTPLPTLIAPAGGDTVLVMVDDSDFPVLPATATLQVDKGKGFQPQPMEHLGENVFRAVFPAVDCGHVARYYFSIDGEDGDLFTSPDNAPTDAYNVISASDAGPTVFDDDFEADLNWTVTGNATTGQWERGLPAGGGNRGDPPADADGSGFCYLTGNQPGDSDVDNGSTVLTSPLIQATPAKNQAAILSYYRWFDNGGEDDSLFVEISNDGGQNWLTLESVQPGDADSLGGWQLKIVALEDFIQPTDQLQLRFIVSDLGSPSVVEAGVDGISTFMVECQDDTVLLGDVNRDGVISLLDVDPFVGLLTSGQYLIEADINEDGIVNLMDVALFIDLLNG